MNLHFLQIVTALSVVAALAATTWLVVITLRREKYTRERFAFVALTSFVTLAVAILSSLADRESLWEAVGGVIRLILHLPQEQVTPPPVSDHILMVVVLGIVGIFLDRFYRNWDGAYSVRQKELQRYHEPMPFVSEALFEAKRLLTHGSPLELYERTGNIGSIPLILSPSRSVLAWHLQARDLLCMGNRSYEVDPDTDWHDGARCWVGYNARTSAVVAIRCEQEMLGQREIADFISYVGRIPSNSREFDVPTEFIVAIRDSVDIHNIEINGQSLRIESEDSLLQHLVNFSDYFGAIRSRVERQHLTDSELKLADVYTISSCHSEDGVLHENLESYVLDWLAEGSQRQLALLGEFGQGKSTAALMLVYRLVKHWLPGERVPILIELRGKSPRNLTPEELIATWAYPFGIDARGIMKLLIAGKVLLILEGFDEMALAGDSESRLAHFRTLWALCHDGSKILITGRPNFFLDDKELRAMLGIQKSAAAGPYCDAVYLDPFTLGQIGSALRAMPETTAREILDLAGRDQKFLEIVSRGSLLYVVSQLWERENLSRFADRMTSAFVMDLFIRHSFRRQSQKVSGRPDFMVLNESERIYFTSGIAAFMGAVDLPNQISGDQFEKAVRDLYDNIPVSVSTKGTVMQGFASRPLRERLSGSEDPVEDICNDVRSAGILVFDQSKSGSLRFAHKSFMEFMVASAYAGYINREDRERSAALIAATHLNARHLLRMPVSQIFLGELLLPSLGGSDKKASGRAAAKLLFDLIVVRTRGRGFLPRLQASLSFGTLHVQSLGLELSEEKSILSRFMGSQLRIIGRAPFVMCVLVSYFLFVPMLYLMRSQVFSMFPFDRSIHHHPPNLLVEVLAGLATFALASLVYNLGIGSERSIPTIRLWLVCCEVVGLSEEDILSVCRSKPLLAVHRRLGPFISSRSLFLSQGAGSRG